MQTLSLEEIKTKVGTEIGVSDWFKIDQERINQFAACTLDDLWIHLDEEKAAKGPFGKTIAHGYLTLSLISPLFTETLISLADEDGSLPVNYGLNKVRMMAPVTVGSRIRDRIVLKAIDQKPTGTLMISAHTIEIEDRKDPALYAETLHLFYND